MLSGGHRRWVVAEVEHRIGFIGMTEQDAIEDLCKRGFETYWMHYRDAWARPKLPNGKRTTKLGKVKEVKRGYFAPFIFVAVEGQDTKAVSSEVEGIREARHIADVLWSADCQFYLPARGYCACGECCMLHRKKLCAGCNWLEWVKSVRIDAKTGIVADPVPIDPEVGLFEPPPDRGPHRAGSLFQPGDRVSTFDKWRAFKSVVKGIDAKGKVIVSHFEAFGADATLAYDPEHLEKV